MAAGELHSAVRQQQQPRNGASVCTQVCSQHAGHLAARGTCRSDGGPLSLPTRACGTSTHQVPPGTAPRGQAAAQLLTRTPAAPVHNRMLAATRCAGRGRGMRCTGLWHGDRLPGRGTSQPRRRKQEAAEWEQMTGRAGQDARRKTWRGKATRCTVLPGGYHTAQAQQAQPESHLEGLHKGRKLAQLPGWAVLVNCCADVAAAKQAVEVPEVAEVERWLWAGLLSRTGTASDPVVCVWAVCCAPGDACKTRMRWCGCSSAKLSHATATQAACNIRSVVC